MQAQARSALASAFAKMAGLVALGVAIWFLLLRLLGRQARSVWNEVKPAKHSRYSDEVLEKLRHEADPITDALIEELANQAMNGTERIQTLLHDLTASNTLDRTDHPQAVGEWIDLVSVLPAAMNPAKIDRAARFFRRHSFLMTLIFGTSSLLEAYACPRGVQVLATTYRLEQDPYRRLGETLQWILLIQDPRGWAVGGTAVNAVLKVRLMHAAIRYLILTHRSESGAPWNQDVYGVPICGEDLLGMLMGFAAVPIRDLPKLDVGIGREDAEAQIHLWCVVGALIGVNAEFLPNSLREARELVETIEARQQHKAREDPQCADACEKGKGFAAALVEFHRSLAPGTSFDGYAIDVMRDLAGDQLCDWLGIPETGGDHSSRLTLPAPGRPIIANVVGALRGVCGDAICDALHIPTISISPTPPISIPLPDIGGSRRRARLKKAEIWGEALIARPRIDLKSYHRGVYEIPEPTKAQWDKERPNWRSAPDRLVEESR